MKHSILSSVAFVALIFALAFPIATPAAPPTSSRANSSVAQPHPEIRAVVASLRKAEERLRGARHEFGGLRKDAPKASEEAIRQLRTCLQSGQ
jgi:hypothetical protein